MCETDEEDCPLPYTVLGNSLVLGNPVICLRCLQPIREGEAWTKYVSNDDAEFGRYSFIVHYGCPEYWREPPEGEPPGPGD